jgi:hypothetical protein
LQHGASEHCSSWEVGSRNFEPPPTAEPDWSFVDRPCSEQSLAKKEKKKTNPIRSERHVVHACPHLSKTCSLSSETLQTNPQSQRKKSRDKKL